MLTPEEIKAFDGLEESYREMEQEMHKKSPMCHFRKMFLDSDGGDGFGNEQAWWECSVCGHIKEIN